MSSDTYLTIAHASKGLFKNKGSKFMGFTFPVEDEKEVKQHLQTLKKEHAGARHICYAYVIGYKGEHTRANDDGEPTYTAGKPILGQIQSNKLTNTMVAVVRYFGGTLLGVGGLIEAYKGAAEDALNNSHIIEKTIDDVYEINFSFEHLNEVMRIIKEEQLHELSRNFGLKGQLTFSVRKNQSDKTIALFNKNNNISITKINT